MRKILIKLYHFAILYTRGGVAYARKLGVKVGSNSRIYTTNFGSEPFLINLGDNVVVTSGVKFLTHDGSACLVRNNKGRRYLYAPIEIGNNVFIGVNSIIMPGVKIEDNVIVAAGSVVTKSIRAEQVVGGVPAKILGNFVDFKQKVLNSYISDADLNLTLPYKERVLSVVTRDHKPFL